MRGNARVDNEPKRGRRGPEVTISNRVTRGMMIEAHRENQRRTALLHLEDQPILVDEAEGSGEVRAVLERLQGTRVTIY